MAIRVSVYGPEHTQVAIIKNNMGDSLDRQGRRSEALTLFREALAGMRRGYPADHPYVLAMESNVASALLGLDRIEEAVEELRALHQKYARVLGAQNPETANAIVRLAAGLIRAGQIAEGEELIRRARTIGWTHADPGAIELSLGESFPVHVLAPGADGRVRLLQFQGRGDLVGWLRVMATREFQLRRRRAQRTSARGDEALLERVETTRDAELTLLRHRYRADFQRAIEEGLRTLTARQRNLLRQELLDGLEQHEIGALYGVHRVTIARWLAAARRELLAETRRLLRERLGLDTEALRSALRLVRSDLDLSLRGALDDERNDLVDPAAAVESPPSKS
jgi:RNA polymerase sigma-70 factor